MKSRLQSGLEILAKMTILSLAVTIFLYVWIGGSYFQGLRRVFIETLVYSNIIAFPSYWIFPRLFRHVSHRRPFEQWAIFVVTMIAISSVGSVLGSALLFAFRLEPRALFTNVLWVSFRICVFLSVLVGVIQAMLERMKGRLEHTELKLRTEELARERAVKLATEARLSSLEARLHPHFLFNTLNSISSLIPADPERAERLVERMAALLRFSLDAHHGGLVTLGQEMKVVQDYLEIEQTRLGSRLRYRIEANEGLLELGLPALSIQTLVENSIKYAIAPNREGGEVRVHAERHPEGLQIEVADSGPGFQLDSAPAGHGLDNLKGRLAALFGDKASLTATRNDGWTTVTLRVPE